MRRLMKNALRSMLFIGGLAILLFAVSQLLIPKNNTADDGMQDPSANGILGEHEKTIDLLILGDSESYSAFIPMKLWEQYGITSYCCGTSGQKLCYSEEFLHKAFRNQSPKVVILETNAIFRDFTFGDMLLHRANMTFPIFTYHNRWKSLKLNDLNMAANYTYIEHAKGYQFSTIVSPADESGYMKKTDALANIPRRNQVYLERMKDYCEENGAKLIFVSTPSTLNWNMARHNATQAIANELEVEYVDLNLMKQQVPIDWKRDTRDRGDHLNHFGAEKVTSYIGKYLSDIGLLPNHKGEEQFSNWDIALKTFNETISAAIPNVA